MSGGHVGPCACKGPVHSPECPEVRPQRDAFLEGERKAWRALDLNVSQKRRDYAGSLFAGVRAYEEHHFRQGGAAARALAGSGGKGRALYAPVEAGKEAYARTVAAARAAYLDAFSQASEGYREAVEPLRAAFEAARVRAGQAPAGGAAESSVPWLPRAKGEPAGRAQPSMAWVLPATSLALMVGAASLAIQGLSDPSFLLFASMVFAVALLGLCAWGGAAVFWRLSIVALAAGALAYGNSTGQWAAAMAPLAMAVLILGAFSGLGRKTFLNEPRAHGGEP